MGRGPGSPGAPVLPCCHPSTQSLPYHRGSPCCGPAPAGNRAGSRSGAPQTDPPAPAPTPSPQTNPCSAGGGFYPLRPPLPRTPSHSAPQGPGRPAPRTHALRLPEGWEVSAPTASLGRRGNRGPGKVGTCRGSHRCADAAAPSPAPHDEEAATRTVIPRECLQGASSTQSLDSDHLPTAPPRTWPQDRA